MNTQVHLCVLFIWMLCFVVFMFWGKERKERGEKKRKAHGKVELCCCIRSFRNTCDTDTWFYILKTIYKQRQKASFVDCQHNKKRKSAGIKIYHNSKTGSSVNLSGTSLHAFPMTGAWTHAPSCPLLPAGDPDPLDHIKKNQPPCLINISSP